MSEYEGTRCPHCNVMQFDNPNADPALSAMDGLCWKCVKPLKTRRELWLDSLDTGDRVMAGVGYHAELRGPIDAAAIEHGVVVRCLICADDGWTGVDGTPWYGHHHARVAVDTIQPWVEPKDIPGFEVTA